MHTSRGWVVSRMRNIPHDGFIFPGDHFNIVSNITTKATQGVSLTFDWRKIRCICCCSLPAGPPDQLMAGVKRPVIAWIIRGYSRPVIAWIIRGYSRPLQQEVISRLCVTQPYESHAAMRSCHVYYPGRRHH